MNEEKNHLEVKKRHFPCLTGDDGKHYFLHSPLTRLGTIRFNYFARTPNSQIRWEEVRRGDTITELDEAGDTIASYNVRICTSTYLIAINERYCKEYCRRFDAEDPSDLDELDELDELHELYGLDNE